MKDSKKFAIEVILTRPQIKRGKPQLDMKNFEGKIRTIDQLRWTREPNFLVKDESEKCAQEVAEQYLKRIGKTGVLVAAAESPSWRGWVLIFDLITRPKLGTQSEQYDNAYDGGGWKSLPGIIRPTPDGRDGFSRDDV